MRTTIICPGCGQWTKGRPCCWRCREKRADLEMEHQIDRVKAMPERKAENARTYEDLFGEP